MILVEFSNLKFDLEVDIERVSNVKFIPLAEGWSGGTEGARRAPASPPFLSPPGRGAAPSATEWGQRRSQIRRPGTLPRRCLSRNCWTIAGPYRTTVTVSRTFFPIIYLPKVVGDPILGIAAALVEVGGIMDEQTIRREARLRAVENLTVILIGAACAQASPRDPKGFLKQLRNWVADGAQKSTLPPGFDPALSDHYSAEVQEAMDRLLDQAKRQLGAA